MDKILRVLMWLFLAFLGFRILQGMWYVREFWMASTFFLAFILVSIWGKIKVEE